MRAKEVIVFTNGNIMVFDEKGNQIPSCQGCFLDTKIIEKLNKYCDINTKFYFGNWNEKVKQFVNVKWWFEPKPVEGIKLSFIKSEFEILLDNMLKNQRLENREMSMEEYHIIQKIKNNLSLL